MILGSVVGNVTMGNFNLKHAAPVVIEKATMCQFQCSHSYSRAKMSVCVHVWQGCD